MNKYDTLNDMQKKAVLQTEGAVLILAGAGSGKTRVLTHRMAYLIEEMMTPAYHILAITFTNKAAKEMKERVSGLIGEAADGAWVSTFHSACIRILKRFADRLGYTQGFTIYDPEDQKSVIRRILKEMDLNEKMFTPRAILGAISAAKDELITPNSYDEKAKGDFFREKVGEIYHRYQRILFENQAMDFDDIIVKTVQLFNTQPDILEYYQEKFRYIMVDEYQDTNMAQYHLIRLLASKYGNLCVVGDDDQSIYRFRGANIRNILDFEKDYPDAMVIRLEQNYRSTKRILKAANAVIHNNAGRKEKSLWTENEEGDPITVYEAWNEEEEASYVTSVIADRVRKNAAKYKDIALLYRTNAQSRALEESLVLSGIPYRLYGGTPFYQRREIKDIMCYLRLIVNDRDYAALDRVINVPKRGIGAVSSERFRRYAEERELGVIQAASQCAEDGELKRSHKKLKAFADMLELLRKEEADLSISKLIDRIVEETAYENYLHDEDPEHYEDRLHNIEELTNRAAEFEEGSPDPSLIAFLEELALVAAIDNYEEGSDAVSLMTLHSAKGLEFPIVFMTGMEDGVFPGYQSITSEDEEDIEEERRLCYVGITRAKKRLYMTHAKSRRIHGVEQMAKPSRFMMEMPEELLEEDQDGKRLVREPVKTRKFVNTPKVSYTNRYVGASSQPLGKPRELDSFAPGDLVTHKKFGLGTVLEVTSLNADYQVKVHFAKVGDKTLLARISGIQKVKEP